MKARPILFSGPMIQALLDGRKTQTRRVVKPQPPVTVERCANFALMPPREDGTTHVAQWMPGMLPLPRCPYGKPGDLLWVRETFSYLESFQFFNTDVPEHIPDAWYWADGSPEWGDWTRPKPSIHMPRWASRLTLRLTGVRAERLQDTSDEDAVAEGIEGAEIYGGRYWRDYSLSDADAQCSPMLEDPRDSLRTLWDSINAQRGCGWGVNPWVWVLSFEVIRANVDEVTRDAA